MAFRNYSNLYNSNPTLPLIRLVTGSSAPAPTVSAITPNTGSTLGGTAITNLAGTGFQTGCTVKIGGAAATSVVRVSATKITCVTPAGAAGAKNVVVKNPDGQDSGTSGNGLFTYVAIFDISTLPLTLYQRSEDIVITHPVAGQSRLVWTGTASAGTSGDGRETFDTGDVVAHITNGPALGAGQPTLFLNKPINNPVAIYTDATHATPLDGASVISTTDASGWMLCNVQALSGGTGTFADPAIMGLYQPRLSLLVGGTTNDKAEIEAAFSTIAQAPLTLGVWALFGWRFNQVSGIEVRVNQSSWAQHAQGALSLFGDAYVLGANGQAQSMNGYYAHMGAAQTKFSDATFDNIYSAIKATYPGAALP